MKPLLALRDVARRVPPFVRVAPTTMVAVASLATSGSAQLTAMIDGGGSRITYAGADGLSVGSVSPSVEWLTPSTSVVASGSFAQFAGGGWSLQGTTAGSVFTPLVAGVLGELAAAAVGSTYQDGGAGEVLGRGRIHWLGANGGAWIGAAAGRAWNGVQWQVDRRGDVGAWLRRDVLMLTATAAPAWLGDSLRFLDADVTARLTQGPFDVTASGGLRHWARPAEALGSTWGAGSAAFWLGAHLAIVAAGGSYPADYAQGLPGGTYLSLGFRLASRRPGHDMPRTIDDRRSTSMTSVVHAGTPKLLTPVAAAFEVRPADSANRTYRILSLRTPAARQVELMGDFTLWRPIALTHAADGSWNIALSIEPGVYRMNVRLDGGPWGVPAGLPAVADDFGSLVGVLKIEAP